MVSWEAIVTICILVITLGLMIREIAPPDMLMLGAVTLLTVLQIITIQEATVGFSNTGMLTVAVLFVVAAGIHLTGAIDPIRKILERHANARNGVPRPLTRVLAIVLTPILLLSSVLNNTPVVAMMIPVLDLFGRRARISPSKLLMPLSFASILGGTCTLIGTSTNLVALGLIQQMDPNFSISFFEIGQVGVPVMLAGMLYILLAAPRLLPARLGITHVLDHPREYITVVEVKSDDHESSIAGKTVLQAGLRNLHGLYIVQIERGGEMLATPGPDTILLEGDRLYLAGVVSSVLSLAQIPGLRVSEDQSEEINLNRLRRDHILVEAVIANHSALVHHTPSELNFRSRFNAGIVAVHRHGTRINETIGQITLQAGDTLLLLTDKTFLDLHHDRDDFALVSKVDGYTSTRRNKAWIAALLTLGMIGAALADVSLLLAGFVAAAGMLVFRCLSPREARDSINLAVVFVISAAFGLSQATINSGAAQLMADGLLAAASPTGTTGLYICVYIATVLFSSIITNNAAITIMFPIAYEAALDANLDFRPILYILMMGASASFMTPTGYQTNLMVYGPGGYKFIDFIVFGGPLQVVVGVVTIGVVVALEFWWLWSLALLGANILVLVFSGQFGARDTGAATTVTVDRIGEAAEQARPVKYYFQPDMGLDEIHGDLPGSPVHHVSLLLAGSDTERADLWSRNSRHSSSVV